MILNMSSQATEEQIDHVMERIKELGCQAHVSRGEERTVIGVVGNTNSIGANSKRCDRRPASRN